VDPGWQSICSPESQQACGRIYNRYLPLASLPPQMSLFALAIIFIAFLVFSAAEEKDWGNKIASLHYMLFQSVIALLSLWLIAANNYTSDLYFEWLFILLLIDPVGSALSFSTNPHLKLGALAFIVLMIVAFQTNLNQTRIPIQSLCSRILVWPRRVGHR
jgi:hypothetical protein